MRNVFKLIAVPALVLLAACGRDDDAKAPVDDALRNDLALAAQVQPYQPQQFVSPMEQAYMQQAYGQPQLMTAGAYAGPYAAPQRAPVQAAPTRTRTIYRTAPAPARQEIKRNTKRDAIIGATAGAAIGVATSRDKLKGGLIGAAVGGLAGAVIGHTVDVERP
jgi:hypothetical protein